MQLDDLREKRIGILGLGVENISLVNWLIRHNITSDITICDASSEIQNSKFKIQNQSPKFKIEYRTGRNYLENLTDFDIVFRTPGIPFLSKEIQNAKKAGVEICSATKLFFDLCPAKIIGVTGTKGKGTTSTLISEILKCNFQFPRLQSPSDSFGGQAISNFQSNLKSQFSNSKIYLGGNIGRSPFDFLDEVKPDDIVVLELSSFQLQDLHKSPHIAVILNITSDHLDIHQNQREYLDAKFNIVKHQTKNDFAVINADYLTSVEFGAGTKAHTIWFSTKKSVDEGSFVSSSPKTVIPHLMRNLDSRFRGNDNRIVLRKNDQDFEICETDELQLIGKHNWENVCVAVAVAGILDIESKIIREAVINFRGLEHRLEFVREIRGIGDIGVKFYNDSFSTNPGPTIAAIKSFPENNIHLILGGSSKGADFSELVAEIKNSKNIKSLIFLGNDEAVKIRKMVERPRFAKASQGKQIKLINAENMEDALRKTKELTRGSTKESGRSTKRSDVVLLSPACASFDLFENYKKRGEAFKNAVLQLS